MAIEHPSIKKVCSECWGDGTIDGARCWWCGGTGWIEVATEISGSFTVDGMTTLNIPLIQEERDPTPSQEIALTLEPEENARLHLAPCAICNNDPARRETCLPCGCTGLMTSDVRKLLPALRDQIRAADGRTPPPPPGISVIAGNQGIMIHDYATGEIFQAPAEVDGYPLGRIIARGGNGTIFLTQSLINHDIPLAIKIIRKSSARQTTRFCREIAAISALDHPHIVKVLNTGEDVSWIWYTMPCYSGTLAEYQPRFFPHADLSDKTIPAAIACSLIAQIARTLAYTHTHGFIHRDLKPTNILIGHPIAGSASQQHHREMIVSDWGCVYLHDSDLTRITIEHHVLGTPYYVAPEAISSEMITPKVDQYALGVMLYELLTGNVPYFVQDASALEALYQVMTHAPIPDAHRLNPLVRPGLSLIVKKALAKDPADRFRDCAAFADALIPHVLEDAQ